MRYPIASFVLLLALAVAMTGCDSFSPASDAAGTVASAADASAASNARVIELQFDKSSTGPGTWAGTVSGAFAGDLETVLLGAEESGPILRVEFDWIISNTTNNRDFTARLNGILNLNTGAVVMNGEVIDGYLVGARVHEEGQLVDPNAGQFQGLIRIMPRSAR
jgi:hypothetical protein